MIVTIRSSSSDVISPALSHVNFCHCALNFSVGLPLGQINIGLFADQVRVSSTDTLDSGEGVHNFLLAIDVGVEETQDELDYTQGQCWR